MPVELWISLALLGALGGIDVLGNKMRKTAPFAWRLVLRPSLLILWKVGGRLLGGKRPASRDRDSGGVSEDTQVVADCQRLQIRAIDVRAQEESRGKLGFPNLLAGSTSSIHILAWAALVLTRHRTAIETRFRVEHFRLDVVLPHPEFTPLINPFGQGPNEYYRSYLATLATVRNLLEYPRVHFYLTTLFPPFRVMLADGETAVVQQLGVGITQEERLAFRVEVGPLIDRNRKMLAIHMGDEEHRGERFGTEILLPDLSEIESQAARLVGDGIDPL